MRIALLGAGNVGASVTKLLVVLLPTIIAMSLTRVGSPSALNTRASCCAVASSSGCPGMQQVEASGVLSMVAGRAFMAPFCPTH